MDPRSHLRPILKELKEQHNAKCHQVSPSPTLYQDP